MKMSVMSRMGKGGTTCPSMPTVIDGHAIALPILRFGAHSDFLNRDCSSGRFLLNVIGKNTLTDVVNQIGKYLVILAGFHFIGIVIQ
jgi:hypothetical protein